MQGAGIEVRVMDGARKQTQAMALTSLRELAPRDGPALLSRSPGRWGVGLIACAVGLLGGIIAASNLKVPDTLGAHGPLRLLAAAVFTLIAASVVGIAVAVVRMTKLGYDTEITVHVSRDEILIKDAQDEAEVLRIAYGDIAELSISGPDGMGMIQGERVRVRTRSGNTYWIDFTSDPRGWNWWPWTG